ncbi:MAG: RNA polymerase sigma factor [Myxococcota bacterium]
MIGEVDRDCFERAQAGDVEALSVLIEPFLGPVAHWAARLSSPGMDPEDIAHEVFIVVFRKIREVYGPEHFHSWLYGITRRTVSKFRRRAWLKRWAGPLDDQFPDGGVTPSGEYATYEATMRIHEILDQMSEKQREVLILIDIEQRTAPEVSRLLRISEGTVRSRLRLARRSFIRLAIATGLKSLSSIEALPALEGES